MPLDIWHNSVNSPFLPDIFVIFLHPLAWILTVAVIVAGWIGHMLAGHTGIVGGVIGLMVAVIVVKSIQEHRQPKPDQSTKGVLPADRAIARKFRA